MAEEREESKMNVSIYLFYEYNKLEKIISNVFSKDLRKVCTDCSDYKASFELLDTEKDGKC